MSAFDGYWHSLSENEWIHKEIRREAFNAGMTKAAQISRAEESDSWVSEKIAYTIECARDGIEPDAYPE